MVSFYKISEYFFIFTNKRQPNDTLLVKYSNFNAKGHKKSWSLCESNQLESFFFLLRKLRLLSLELFSNSSCSSNYSVSNN